MDAKDIIVIAAAGLSATVTIAVPVVNHILARRKFGSDKIWELRRDVYSRIIFDISEASKWYWFASQLSEKPSKAGPQSVASKGQECFTRAQALYRENFLTCSKAFRSAMDGTGVAEYTVWRDDDVSLFSTALKELHTELIRLAHRELNL